MVSFAMGLFGPTTRSCPRGVWTTLLLSHAAGMPAYWTVRFEAPGGAVGGLVRESRSALPFGIAMSTPAERPLVAQMEFARGWFDASHRVDVMPAADVVATID